MSTEDFSLKTLPRSPREPRSAFWRERLSRRRTSTFTRVKFSIVTGTVDACAIVLSAVVSGLLYHALAYHASLLPAGFVEFGVFIALLFVLCNVLRHEYEISSYLNLAGHTRRALVVWNIAFFTVLLFVFITKTTDDFSRGATLLFYVIGLLTVVSCRAFAVYRIKTDAITGKVVAVRAVLVGSETSIRHFTSRYKPWMYGVDVVASFVLRGADTLRDDLALASASARVLKPDDIYVLLPWTETKTIDAAVDAFVKVPASIHLGPQDVLDRYPGINISHVGNIYSLNVVRRPLDAIDIIVKRVFDLFVAIPLLVLVCPLLVLIALAVKLESRGPALFVQRRYGFNQETFQIVKFRSMHVTEEGRRVKQAMRDDPRVTRVGRILRRFNLDELPQLLNVIRGEMSLVGPRPHALVHNQQYERSIADYARRHNVKPGITGWAQIHGLRGGVSSDAIMRQRVEYDLYYIDNWSIGFDVRILALTVLSPKAFANAY